MDDVGRMRIDHIQFLFQCDEFNSVLISVGLCKFLPARVSFFRAFEENRIHFPPQCDEVKSPLTSGGFFKFLRPHLFRGFLNKAGPIGVK